MKRAAFVALLSWLPVGAMIAGGPLPFDVTVLVSSPGHVGREALREEAARLLAWEVQSAACFREVAEELPDAPDAEDLAFRVTFLHVKEETEWGMSLAQRHSPNQSQQSVNRSQVARIRVDLLLELVTVAEERLVRSKSIRVAKGYRPAYSEDPRPEARQRLLEEAVLTARKWACKGSEKSLRKEIAKARPIGPETPAAD